MSLDKICQRKLLIEYMIRYGSHLPDEKMLDVIDVNVMEELSKEISLFCKRLRHKKRKTGNKKLEIIPYVV